MPLPLKKLPGDFLDGLKMIIHCPVCNSEFKQMETRILEERNDAHLVHICCKRCLTSVLAVITMNDLGASSLGLVTDLTCDDVIKFKDASEVTANDVLEIHELLEEGRFKELI